MGLSNPGFRVEGSGAKTINARLISFTREDMSGIKSDSLELLVDATGLDSLPPEDGELTWFEGYGEELVDKGRFIISQVIPTFVPPRVKVIATAAPFKVADSSAFRERKTRSFTDMTLGDIFRQVVGEHGFSARVASELDGVLLEHVDQVDETDPAFLTRLARERDAVAKPFNDLYVLAMRGQLKTISGQSIPPYPVNPPAAGDGAGYINYALDLSSRKRFKGVKAVWTNQETGDEKEVQAGDAPYKKLRQPYQSEALANKAAEDELKRIFREGNTLKLELPGSPELVAEGLLVMSDSFQPSVSGEWSIDKVVVKGDASGSYRCSVSATSPLK